ncbi:hypothetical protein DICPUDRAFT_78124 [Dictyostelium purpureum]|uniref:Peptidase S49 domain-containing protein n=1 Tax=Dictyostelium purpureum TaxID=5786 RepID=F0ZIM1_DICPU|nr:uncharacterized protein DICPUDRAFT_78124 [Dictyostelium purpureum]EGC36190.1 hypothetical protein DICPUDRAFT_78124 [Dictyostelium purpureum]|eukprot:XP_003287257.1 hypothetical protein DICPUDRAFT_78124 [Dictyostelium purpureum]
MNYITNKEHFSHIKTHALGSLQYINQRPLLRWFLLSAGFFTLKKIGKIIKNRVKNNTILEIDFTQNIDTSDVGMNPIEKIFEPNTITFKDILESLEKASTDKKIIGLIVKLGGENQLSLSNIQEFRNAVQAFKKSGKRAVVFTDSFTEVGSGIARYYLASAFTDVYMSPAGTVNLINSQYDFAFVKGTLEKLGVVPDALTRKEYKSALNSLINEKLTEAEKESMNAIFKSLYDQIILDISKDRGLTVDQVNGLFETGPFSADKALVNKLIDATLYSDEVYTTTYEKLNIAKENANLLFAHKYNQKSPRLYSKKNKNLIALINCEGTIHQGAGKTKFNGGPSIGSDSLVLAIRSAVQDKDVKAIILRVNSGGGSYIASDLVHHEIEAAKKAGKKIVVSMGTYCASGGYFIACNADKIIALGATLTGSIGVLTAKFNLQPMWKKIGVTFDDLRLNPDGTKDNATYFSSLHNYNEKQLSDVNNYLDFIYEDFTSKVSKGRRLTRDQVEEIARGRVWTGSQALDNGLVDKIGGIKEAIEAAKELCSMPSTSTPYVVTYPKENIVQALLSQPNSSRDLEKRGLPVQSSISLSSIGVVTSIFTKFTSLSKLVLGLPQTKSIVSNLQTTSDLSMDINQTVVSNSFL